MAALNSLTYIMYSLLTLAPNNTPTTEPSLNAFETSSESLVTETWRQEPHYVTRKFNEESCPAGETWSECDAGCQETCETVGEPQVCPRMCVPGCVCEDPGTVRGPDNKCIHPPLCKSEKESCPAGETWSDCDAGCQETCETVGKPQICPRMCVPGCVCEYPGTVRGPDNKCIYPPLCESGDVDPDETVWTERYPVTPRVDPYDRVRAEQDPYISSVDPDESIWSVQYPVTSRVNPDERVRAEQDPIRPRVDPDESSRAKIFWQAKRYPKVSRVEPDESSWSVQYPVTPRVDTYERVRAEQDPYIPSVDPDESIWSVQYPVTPRVDPDERVRAEQDPNLPRVEPDEPSRTKIFWQAERYPKVSRVDPDEIVGAEQDPDIRRVDPDEHERAEQDIDIRRGLLNDGGCPNYSACVEHCLKQRYKYGECVGPTGTFCNCYGPMDSVDPNKPRGILRSGGCPNNNACTENCRKRGKKVGSCQGMHRLECLCFNHW